MTFMKPCNDPTNPYMDIQSQEDTKLCGEYTHLCCLHCAKLRLCIPRWETYRHSHEPKRIRDAKIVCFNTNRPMWCSSVLDYVKANPDLERKLRIIERVDFT